MENYIYIYIYIYIKAPVNTKRKKSIENQRSSLKLSVLTTKWNAIQITLHTLL